MTVDHLRHKISARPILSLFGGILLALTLSCVEHRGGCLANLRFNLGIGREADRGAIRQTIKDYNSVTSGFYSSGGYLEELRYMPAHPLVKRKHYQNIELLNKGGVVLVFDADKVDIRNIHFYSRTSACAIADETWVMGFQDVGTRKKLSRTKGSQLRVRYMLERQKGKWIIDSVEVFPASEEVTFPDFRRL